MEDVNISKYRASVVREGSKPASPGFVVSEGQSPTDPAGTGQNHLPVTIAAASTGLSITESQILSGAGTVSQYIRGDGSLADFPEASGGGSSVSYYLNGSVNQGTIGGVAYKELNKVPILGAGTDFTINANGYIASFLTDAGDPNLLEIPGGNWNFETYFSASSGGGSPTFYVELYKYDGTTFTLIASNSTFPELIAFGTNIISYFSTLAVPTTTLALTDRLAIRYYVTHSGRTITLHTEDNHLCQIITTFTTGITALNGLTAQVQNFATGTSGTDFAIASATATHTFNLPTASATNRGALSSGDWTTFNNKENAITAGTTAQYFRGDKTFQTLNTSVVPELTNLYYTEARVNANTNVAANTAARHNAVTLGTANGLSLSTQVLSLGLASAGVTGALSGTDWSTFNAKQNALGYTPVPETRTITINGTTQDLSANRTFNVGTVTSVGLSSATSGVTIGSTPVTTSGTITLAIATASGSQNGLLSSTDWTTFNSKQNALTNPVTGTGTTNYLAKFTGSTTVGNSLFTDNGTIAGVGNSLTGNARFNILNIASNPALSIRSANNLYEILTMTFDESTDLFSITNKQAYSLSGIAFGTNNTQRMLLDVNGNFGIGINPKSKLQVFGGTGAYPTLGTNVTNSIFISRNDGLLGTYFGYAADGNGWIQQMRNDSATAYNLVLQPVGGNLLVGTTTDGGARLQIVSSGIALNIATGNGQMANINSTNANGGYITWQTSGTTIADLGTAQQIFGAGGSDTFGINARGARSLILGTNDTARFTIASTGFVSAGAITNGRLGVRGFTNDSSGYALEAANASGNTLFIVRNDGISTFAGSLGINTYSPSTALHVISNDNSANRTSPYNVATITATSANAPYNGFGTGLVFAATHYNGLVYNGARIRTVLNDNSIVSLGNSIAFDVTPTRGGTLTEAMKIDYNGNVGIGTTSPIYKLVVSNSGATGLEIDPGTIISNRNLLINYNRSTGSYSQIQIDASLTILGNQGNVLIGSTTDNGSKLQVNGAIRTAQPVGTTSNGWLLGRALVSGTSTPDRWIRVQIGLEYYDILAVYMGTL